MKTLEDYLSEVEKEEERKRIEELLIWIEEKYPELDFRMAWNQPMFTHEGTFIIGISRSKNHLALAPEKKTLDIFSEEIKTRGYDHGKQIIRMPWDKELDYELLAKLIDFNIKDNKGMKTFWRKV